MEERHRSTARVLAPLFVAAFFAFAYNNVFMTLSPSFAVERGLTLAEGGLQNSVLLAVAVVLRFAFGPAADRWGTRPVMAVGLGAFVVGGALFPLCEAFWQIVAVRCVQAVGLASFWSSATTTVANVAPPERQGWWLGLYRVVTSAALLLGPSLAFALVDAMGFAVCFWAMTAGAAVALGCVLSMRGAAVRPIAVVEGESDASVGGTGRVQATGDRSVGARLRGLVRDARALDGPTMAVVLGGTFAAAMGYGLLFSFTRSFMGAVDPTLPAGWYFTLLGVGGLAINPFAGLLADRVSQRRLLGLWLGCAGVGVALLGLLSAASADARWALFVLSGLLVGVGYAGTVTTAQVLASARTAVEHRASALALQQNAIDLGIACASAVFGVVFAAAGEAATAPFFAQGALMVILGVAFIAVRRV